MKIDVYTITWNDPHKPGAVSVIGSFETWREANKARQSADANLRAEKKPGTVLAACAGRPVRVGIHKV